jgi:thiamine biosynthesis lipoprotein ApbE
MKRKTIIFIVIFALLFPLAGCRKEPEQKYMKYSDSFFDTFNTLTQVVAFTKSKEEFDRYYESIHARFQELHKLYDIYNNYERFYIVDGKVIHHLIDPKTLMPGEYYHAVSVVAQDSGVADFMSTTLFLMPFEESLALAESIEGVEALWVMRDGTIRATEGMKKIMKSKGATNSGNQ